MDHLGTFDEELADELRLHPEALLSLVTLNDSNKQSKINPQFEQAAQQVAIERTFSQDKSGPPVPLQITLKGEASSTALRDLTV